MRYLVYEPRPPLREHVAYLWTLSDAPGHARERIVPTGTIELVINLHADGFRIFDPFAMAERQFRGAIVSGCYTRAFEIDTRAHALIVGVHIKPGAAGCLLGVPPGTLGNRHVGLDELWGRAATDLRERLCSEPNEQARFSLLEEALLARMSNRAHHHDRVAVALNELERPGVEVGDVAKTLSLSRRRLIEIFSEQVGMTPKRYSIVRRFQRALAAALRCQSVNWTRIALDCGYYDQAHLCRDWSELTGAAPQRYVDLCSTPVKESHVAIPNEGVKSVQYRHERHG